MTEKNNLTSDEEIERKSLIKAAFGHECGDENVNIDYVRDRLAQLREKKDGKPSTNIVVDEKNSISDSNKKIG